MEKKLNDYLREGERVQWQGKPESFQLMENGCKMQILRKWILSVVFASGLLACYLHYNEDPGVKFAAVVILVAAVVMVVIPVLVVYIFLQNYIIKGMTAGAVKG